MRPTLLQYLNNQIPPLTQIKKITPVNNEIEEVKTQVQVVPSEAEASVKKKVVPVVRSVIDENIRKEKTKNKKRAKPKPKGFKYFICNRKNALFLFRSSTKNFSSETFEFHLRFEYFKTRKVL